MKKILILILLLCLPVLSQFQSSLNLWRVISVSTNYKNVYPRYSTLQNAFNSCVDSANAGKYFIINISTATQNVTDYTSVWKDSILAHDPFIKLTAFGQAINDSIIGITIEEFDLIAGIISLDPATAGSGLYFSSHAYHIRAGDFLLITNDTLNVYVNANEFELTAPLSLNYKFNHGITVDTGGIGVHSILPLKTSRDSVSLLYKSPLRINTDSLELYYNDQHFETTAPFSVRMDSGLTSSADGIRAWVDNVRLGYTSAKRITISDATGGHALVWQNDSLNLIVGSPFETAGDSLWMNFNTDQFNISYSASPKFSINLDSGMTYDAGGIKPDIDYATLIFNSLMELAINPTFAGGGLLITAGVMAIVPNDFAKVENDTLKIKTSSVLTWFGDSLTSTIFYVPPYDTLGIGMFAKGNVKRVAINYVTDSGNDTTVMNFLDASWNAYDRIALVWDNSQMKFKIYKNKILWQTLAGCANLTSPYKKDWNVAMETYLEAQ